MAVTDALVGYDAAVQPTPDNSAKPSRPPVLKILDDAVSGLTYPSDSDEPWQAFVWPETKPFSTFQAALAQHVDTKRAIVEVAVENFFEQLSDADNAATYQALRGTLQRNLENVSVFRVGDGEVRVDVFVIGHTTDAIAGIRTASIET